MKNKKEIIISILLLVVGVFWGGGFIAVKFALDAGMSPSLINFCRFFIATVLLFAIFFKRIVKITKKEFFRSLLPSLMMALGFFFQSTALKFTSAGNNALITGAYIVIVPIIAVFVSKILPSKKAVIAAVVSFIGITILSIPSFNLEVVGLGEVLTLVCAVFFALHFIALDKVAKDVDSFKLTFMQMAVASVCFLVYFLVFDTSSVKSVDVGAAILPLLYSGIFASVIAYLIQTYAQKYISPSKTAVLLSSECAFGAIFSIMLGLEALTIYIVVGGILTMVGIILAQKE